MKDIKPEVRDIIEAVRPLFREHSREDIGEVLGHLVATWVIMEAAREALTDPAAFTPKRMRSERKLLLEAHVEHVEECIPIALQHFVEELERRPKRTLQ